MQHTFSSAMQESQTSQKNLRDAACRFSAWHLSVDNGTGHQQTNAYVTRIPLKYQRNDRLFLALFVARMIHHQGRLHNWIPNNIPTKLVRGRSILKNKVLTSNRVRLNNSNIRNINCAAHVIIIRAKENKMQESAAADLCTSVHFKSSWK